MLNVLVAGRLNVLVAGTLNVLVTGTLNTVAGMLNVLIVDGMDGMGGMLQPVGAGGGLQAVELVGAVVVACPKDPKVLLLALAEAGGTELKGSSVFS